MGITFPPQMRTGSPEAMAVQNIGRQQAFILRQQLALGKLNMGTRRVTLNNGIEITCTYCFGKEDIWVKIPPVLTSQSLEVKTEYTMLVCVPRALAADNGFALTDVKTQYGMYVSADPEFKYGTASKVTEVERGNYCIQAEDGTVYSIVAPPHHMAGEPDNKTLIPGYTRYAWTTNVTGLDIHTCYSEYVYSKGKAVFTGTPAPPESEFFSGLIVGVGVDADGKVHVAQLSGIGTGQGYWMIKSKGADVGVFFGSGSGAEAEADKLEDGSFAVIWKNETAARWWVEFHSTNCPASGLLPKTLNIYRREQATRPGLGNRQWFFDPEWEEWSQIATSVPNELIFEGFKYVGSLKNTVYKFLLGAEKVNEKLVTLTHKATSLSGATGTFTEVDMKVYRETDKSIRLSVSDGWPYATGSSLTADSLDKCNPINFSVSGLPSYFVTEEIKPDHEYRLTHTDHENDPCGEYEVNGSVTATSPYTTVTQDVHVDGTGRPGIGFNVSGYGSYGVIVGTTFTASGGIGPYSYSFSGGGITSSGVITSLPSCPVATGTVTATDQCGTSGSIVVRLEVPTAGWHTTYESFPYGIYTCGYVATYMEYTEDTETRKAYRIVCTSIIRANQEFCYQPCRVPFDYGNTVWLTNNPYWSTFSYGSPSIIDSKWYVIVGDVESGAYMGSCNTANKTVLCSEYWALPQTRQALAYYIVAYVTVEWRCP